MWFSSDRFPNRGQNLVVEKRSIAVTLCVTRIARGSFCVQNERKNATQVATCSLFVAKNFLRVGRRACGLRLRKVRSFFVLFPSLVLLLLKRSLLKHVAEVDKKRKWNWTNRGNDRLAGFSSSISFYVWIAWSIEFVFLIMKF